jgi:hypothetical protein
LAGAATTGEGATAMGFYNVQKGDVPYFKSLADTYSMSDYAPEVFLKHALATLPITASTLPTQGASFH